MQKCFIRIIQIFFLVTKIIENNFNLECANHLFSFSFKKIPCQLSKLCFEFTRAPNIRFDPEISGWTPSFTKNKQIFIFNCSEGFIAALNTYFLHKSYVKFYIKKQKKNDNRLYYHILTINC